MAAPLQCLLCWRGLFHEPQSRLSCRERAALRALPYRNWIQSEALRAIKSNASPARGCFPEAHGRALDLRGRDREGREQSQRVGGVKAVPDNPGCEATKALGQVALKCEEVASASGGMGRGDTGRKLCFLIVYKAPSHIHTPLCSGDNRLRERSNLPSRCTQSLDVNLISDS